MKWSDLIITVNTDGSPSPQHHLCDLDSLSYTSCLKTTGWKNSTVGGLWFGKYPEMTVFMKKLVELNDFGQVIWKKGSTVITSSLYVACFCVDTPVGFLLEAGHTAVASMSVPGVLLESM